MCSRLRLSWLEDTHHLSNTISFQNLAACRCFLSVHISFFIVCIGVYQEQTLLSLTAKKAILLNHRFQLQKSLKCQIRSQSLTVDPRMLIRPNPTKHELWE